MINALPFSLLFILTSLVVPAQITKLSQVTVRGNQFIIAGGKVTFFRGLDAIDEFSIRSGYQC